MQTARLDHFGRPHANGVAPPDFNRAGNPLDNLLHTVVECPCYTM